MPDARFSEQGPKDLRAVITDILKDRFSSGIVWTMGALVVTAICGLAFHLLIGLVAGAEALGIFNQVYALFIVFGQFAAMGVHFSALKYTAEHADDGSVLAALVAAAFVALGLVALPVTAAFVLLADTAAALLDSPAVAEGVLWAGPGLLFFSINKLQLGVLNGLRHMRLYAVLQGSRAVLIVAGVAIALALDWPAGRLPWAFTLGEGVVMVAALPFVLRTMVGQRLAGIGDWIVEHFRFGFKGFSSGLLLELNTRVDVLMLGLFLSDRIVGLYSFAAIIAEGFHEILVVLRNNYNPRLTRCIADGDTAGLEALVRRGRLLTYKIMLPVLGAAALLYPVGIWVIAAEPFAAAWGAFAILLAGQAGCAGYVPFGRLLIKAGYPGWQSIMITSLVTFNIIANAALIPLLGMEGAALATALSMVALVPVLKSMGRRIVGVAL